MNGGGDQQQQQVPILAPPAQQQQQQMTNPSPNQMVETSSTINGVPQQQQRQQQQQQQKTNAMVDDDETTSSNSSAAGRSDPISNFMSDDEKRQLAMQKTIEDLQQQDKDKLVEFSSRAIAVAADRKRVAEEQAQRLADLEARLKRSEKLRKDAEKEAFQTAKANVQAMRQELAKQFYNSQFAHNDGTNLTEEEDKKLFESCAQEALELYPEPTSKSQADEMLRTGQGFTKVIGRHFITASREGANSVRQARRYMRASNRQRAASNISSLLDLPMDRQQASMRHRSMTPTSQRFSQSKTSFTQSMASSPPAAATEPSAGGEDAAMQRINMFLSMARNGVDGRSRIAALSKRLDVETQSRLPQNMSPIL